MNRTQIHTQTRHVFAHIRQRSLDARIAVYLRQRALSGCQRTRSINLGVKWSQVQILSARLAFKQFIAHFWLGASKASRSAIDLICA
jgi:hypothetical protein